MKTPGRFPEESWFLPDGDIDDMNTACFDKSSILGKVINSVLSYALGLRSSSY
jgi:hypothetical protein